MIYTLEANVSKNGMDYKFKITLENHSDPEDHAYKMLADSLIQNGFRVPRFFGLIGDKKLNLLGPKLIKAMKRRS